MTQYKINIDPEFSSAAFIPTLSTEEFAGLEEQIKAEGCREPFIVWGNHNNTLLDGHHRYKICVKHGLSYPQPNKLKFESRDDARNWIIRNQLSRRNITQQQRSYLIGKLYNATKKPVGRPPAENADTVSQLSPAEVLAEQKDISPRTVRRDGKFAEAVDKISDTIGQETTAEILNGELPVSQPQAVELAKLPEEKAAAAVKKIKAGAKAKDVLKKPKKKPKPGREVDKPALKRKATDFLGKLIRALDDLSICDTHKTCLNAISEGIKKA